MPGGFSGHGGSMLLGVSCGQLPGSHVTTGGLQGGGAEGGLAMASLITSAASTFTFTLQPSCFSRSAMALHPQAKAEETIVRQCWRAERPGKISDLRLVTEQLSAPAAGEVRVAIKAVGLNFADVFTCLGLYSAAPHGSYTPGLEFAGVIEAVGEGIDVKRIGERVMGVSRFGAYSSHTNANTNYIRCFPDEWSFVEAASFPVQGLTMMYALRQLGNIEESQTILVHSAAGGCGTVALGICKELKVNVVATVGNANKVKFLLDTWGIDFLPPERIIVRKGGGNTFKEQLVSVLSAMGVEGFDCVIDAVQGDYFSPGFSLLIPGGRYVVYGAASMTSKGDQPNWISLAWKYLRRPMLDPLKMMSENRSIMAFNLIWMFDKVAKMDKLFQELQAFNLRVPIVGERFSFEKAPEALKRLQSGETVGKIVLEL